MVERSGCLRRLRGEKKRWRLKRGKTPKAFFQALRRSEAQMRCWQDGGEAPESSPTVECKEDSLALASGKSGEINICRSHKSRKC